MKKLVYLFAMAALLLSCSRTTTNVFGRYVPERKDDFAWENEYAAYRCYGPALAPENPSNGVDLWFKATPELVIDSFYYRDLTLGIPYHVNFGKGLDGYKVGHTAGCGGLVVMANQQLWVGGPYSRYQILEQTPKKLIFRLTYDSLLVAGIVMQEQLTITCEAGKRLNRADVVLTAPKGAELPSLMVGGAIYLHDSIDHTYINTRTGAIAYAEKAVSDPGSTELHLKYGKNPNQGRAYMAVVTPGAQYQQVTDGCLVSLRPYIPGETLTYYFGGQWSQWHNGYQRQPNDEDWWRVINSLNLR